MEIINEGSIVPYQDAGPCGEACICECNVCPSLCITDCICILDICGINL